MAHAGEKRPAESQDSGGDDEGAPSSKRSTSGFLFRPSPLHNATQGLVLKKPGPSKLETPDAEEPESKKQSTGLLHGGGFLKLNADEIRPINITTPTIMLSGGSGSMGKATNQMDSSKNENAENHTESDASKNPFLQFLSTSSSLAPSFSSLSTTSNTGLITSPKLSERDREESNQDRDESRESESDTSGLESDLLHPMPFGSQPATALLPEVQTPTGEEGEKKIVQVPARLYAFDVGNHSWKERGRGEVRLNDTCQSEGLFQSRLVMRASGSYRVLLNTHLWSQMKCDRANQKSIRIGAQDSEGEISVFLIMGAARDIQQLFTAIDRRIEALRRNEEHEGGEGEEEGTRVGPKNTSFDEEDESFLDDPHSSPDSSPETHSNRLRLMEKPASIPDQDPVSIPDQEQRSSSSASGDGSSELEAKSNEKGSTAEPLSTSVRSAPPQDSNSTGSN